MASSADGVKLVAVSSTTYYYDYFSDYFPPRVIYLSQDSGATWTLAANAPALSYDWTRRDLVISWIIPSSHYVLQMSRDLVHWQNLDINPVLDVSNLENQVTVPSFIFRIFKYFRLVAASQVPQSSH